MLSDHEFDVKISEFKIFHFIQKIRNQLELVFTGI